jgi:epoxyqueuosine reductase QueG
LDWGILKQILPDFAAVPFSDVSPHLIPCRAKKRIPKGAQGVIIAVFPYLLPEEYYQKRNVARFAVVPDYHKIVMARLEKACDVLRREYPINEFVPFADNSPIPEKQTAIHAGLGAIGRNGLFIHPRWGSWVFLGCIITTMVLSLSPGIVYQNCQNCGRCERRCPVGAQKHGKVSRELCLSFRSQGRTADRAELAKKSGVLWGCDICQELCPMNAGVPAEPLEEFLKGANPEFSPSAEERVWAWRFKLQ